MKHNFLAIIKIIHTASSKTFNRDVDYSVIDVNLAINTLKIIKPLIFEYANIDAIKIVMNIL